MRPIHLMLGALLSLPAGLASAAVLSCPGSFTSDGTALVSQASVAGQKSAALACQYLDPPSTSTIADVATVNDADFFGIAPWSIFGSKVDLPDGTQSGFIDLAGADFVNLDYMIVFKDGAGTNLVAFLLNETTKEIDWQSPFRNPPFTALAAGQIKDVSHYSVFQRTGVSTCSPTTDPTCVPGPGGGPDPGTVVPAPATLALLGAALAGLGLQRARRA